MENEVRLRIEVPFTRWKIHRSTEYIETHPFPPPSTVFGFLQSLIGFDGDSDEYAGTEIGIGTRVNGGKWSFLVSRQHVNKEDDKLEPGDTEKGKHFVPKFVEVLTRVEVWVRVCGKLATQAREAVLDPSSVKRWGPLSLGENDHLVSAVDIVEDSPEIPCLIPDEKGRTSMPLRVCYNKTENTVWQRFRKEQGRISDVPVVEIP